MPTWPVSQHPEVWPWIDLVFCSSRQHINRGIIPLMLKLSFVHILLASAWVADTADKWLFLPATPPTSITTNGVSRSRNTGPFNMAFVHTTFGRVPDIWEGISPYGTRRRSKNSRCAFYCNWWPISVLSECWQHWLAPTGTKTPTDAFRSQF